MGRHHNLGHTRIHVCIKGIGARFDSSNCGILTDHPLSCLITDGFNALVWIVVTFPLYDTRDLIASHRTFPFRTRYNAVSVEKTSLPRVCLAVPKGREYALLANKSGGCEP